MIKYKRLFWWENKIKEKRRHLNSSMDEFVLDLSLSESLWLAFTHDHARPFPSILFMAPLIHATRDWVTIHPWLFFSLSLPLILSPNREHSPIADQISLFLFFTVHLLPSSFIVSLNGSHNTNQILIEWFPITDFLLFLSLLPYSELLHRHRRAD